MAIGGIGGMTSRMASLCRLWTDYRDLWHHKESQSHSAPAPNPAPPLAAPTHAMVNPRRGSRAFLVTFSMPVLKASMKKGSAKGDSWEADEHGSVPGHPRKRSNKSVEAIPRNMIGERPIQPDKLRRQTVVDPDHQDRTFAPARQPVHGSPAKQAQFAGAQPLSLLRAEASRQRASLAMVIKRSQ